MALEQFPDKDHFIQLQRDLWRYPQSKASLLVGAGMSLNADTKGGHEKRLPTWRELGGAMFDELFPEIGQLSADEKRLRKAKSEASNPIDLADHYQSRFGRAKLDQLLRSTIPHHQFTPSKLHQQLLSLPWKDVFTTNYDSLLERTSLEEKAYDVVETPQDLGSKTAPRIVKLHGSFEAATPLIVTSEDYRRYAEKHALFINTFRQTLAENCLVLIGFSGTDVNFLTQLGWVRDCLEEYKLPVYLVGALNLEPNRREQWKDLGITPIDLSPLFQDLKDSPKALHQESLSWFLESLKIWKPLPPNRWRRQKNSFIPNEITASRPLLGPVSITQKPSGNSPNQNWGKLSTEVIELIQIWRKDRDDFPGWLFLPRNESAALWRDTSQWVSLLLLRIKSYSAADQLVVIFEIFWRLDTALAPILSDWMPFVEKTTEEAYQNLDFDSTGEICEILNISTSDLKDLLLKNSISLLRDYREGFEDTKWLDLFSKSQKLSQQLKRFEDDFSYEEITFSLWKSDRTTALNLLTNWSPKAPLSLMRKAAALAEFNKIDESHDLLTKCLSDIRSQNDATEPEINLMSLEGWCMFNLEALNHSRMDFLWKPQGESFSSRYEALRVYDCDPWEIWKGLLLALKKQPPYINNRIRAYSFDTGECFLENTVYFECVTERLSAFRYIRSFEVIGIPMQLRYYNMASALSEACEWLEPVGYQMAPRLYIRSAQHKLFNSTSSLQRYQLACLETKKLCQLNRWLLKAFRREIETHCKEVQNWTPSEGVWLGMIELLSRFTIRLTDNELEEHLNLALLCWDTRSLRSSEHLYKKCILWIQRILEASRKDVVVEYLPRLLKSSISESTTCPWIESSQELPDIESALDHLEDLPKTLSKDCVKDIFQELFSSCNSSDTLSAKIAFQRLHWFAHYQTLPSDLQKHFANILWQKNKENEWAPARLEIALANYLHLPRPEGASPETVIRNQLLDNSPPCVCTLNEDGKMIKMSGLESNQWMHDLASVTSFREMSCYFNGTLEWTSTETASLSEKIFLWWKNDKQGISTRGANPFLPHFSNGLIRSTEDASLFFAKAILAKRGQDLKLTELVLEFFREARDLGIPILSSWIFVTINHSKFTSEIVSLLEEALNSSDEKIVLDAAKALLNWQTFTKDNAASPISSHLLHLLVTRITFRRREGLTRAMYFLALLIRYHRSALSAETLQLLVGGLEQFQTRVKMPKKNDESLEFRLEERPLYLRYIAMLTGSLYYELSLSKSSPELIQTLSKIRSYFQGHPLPELRHTIDLWASEPSHS